MNTEIQPKVRRMEYSDLARVLAWRNHPAVRLYMTESHEITPEEHAAWFDRCTEDANRSLLIIEEHDLPIGFLQFTSRQPSIAEWGFYAVPDSPPGTGTRLCQRGVAHGFEELGLRRIEATVMVNNERSLALHRRLGFEPIEVGSSSNALAQRFILRIEQWKKLTAS